MRFALVAAACVLSIVAAVIYRAAASSGTRQPSIEATGSTAITTAVTDFGGTGSDLWAVTAAGTLWLSNTAGASWASASPPVSFVDLSSQQGIAVAQYGPDVVWVVAPTASHQTEEFTKSDDDGATWSAPAPVPTTMSAYQQSLMSSQGAAPDRVYVQLVNAQTGYVALDQFWTALEATATLDVSRDGGSSFTSMSLPTSGPIHFTSPTTGFLLGIPGGQRLYKTVDQGLSWSAVTVVPPSPGNWSVGLPVAQSAGEAVVPVTVRVTGQSASSTLYLMQASGVGSADAIGEPIESTGQITIALGTGSNILAFKSGSVRTYRSTNLGASWISATGSGIPASWSLMSVVSTGSESAVAVAGYSRCPGKQNCSSEAELYSTANGGATWSPVTLGS